MSENSGWGWWSITATLDEMSQRYDVDKLLKAPRPRGNIVPNIQNIESASERELGEILSYCGSYVAYLNAEVGYLEGRLVAVRSSVTIAINKKISELERDAVKKRLVASLEGEAIDSNELLKEGKRLEIELESQLRVALGYKNAWDLLWQTSSREITRRQIMSERRHSN